MADYRERIGKRIRQAREAKGLTQAGLARLLPDTIDGPSVSRWERGKVQPGPDNFEALAAALGVDVAYFMAQEPTAGSTPDLMGALPAGAPDDQLDRIELLLRRIAEQVGLQLADVFPQAEAQADARPARVRDRRRSA